jgi:hypothetical protein
VPFDFETVQRIINSPPAQLAAGGVLAGIVWKFFERVEAVLTDDTKLEIAVWLLGAKVGDQIAFKVQTWPAAFLKVFDSVFTSRPLSWRCFWRSCLVTYGCIVLSFIVAAFFPFSRHRMVYMLVSQMRGLNLAGIVVVLAVSFLLSWPFITIVNGVPNYVALLKTRYAIHSFVKHPRPTSRVLILVADVSGSLIIALGLFFVITSMSWFVSHHSPQALPEFHSEFRPYMHERVRGLLKEDMPLQLLLNCYPTFFGIVWFSFYAVSGFLLKGASSVGMGFQWFTRWFDIEKKPLQSIGLVAGALTALVYWGTVVVVRFF